MAKLIVSQLMSLDGFLAGPGGDLGALPMDGAFDQHNLELLRRAGTLVFGRTTFGMFQDYWPEVAKTPDTEPVQREIASRVQAIAKLVVSDTLELTADATWPEAQVVRREAARERVAQLKAEAAGDLLIHGSTMVWQDLFAAGLVDELHLLVSHVLLGAGVPVFAPGITRSLRLLDQRRLPDSDIAALHYQVAAGIADR